MGKKKKYYDFKFPFTRENKEQGFYCDLNNNKYEAIRSCLIHLIFTPKGQRLKKPEFGCDVIKMLFMPNDEITQSKIKEEISSSVKRHIPIVEIINVEGKVNENGRGYILHIDYEIDEGHSTVGSSLDIEI